jgi:hypothetical protein
VQVATPQWAVKKVFRFSSEPRSLLRPDGSKQII